MLPIPQKDLPAVPGIESESLVALRKTLPDGWSAEYTVEGRLMFWKRDGSLSSWTHPDPEYSHLKSDATSPPEDGLPDFEALSYCWGERYPEQLVHIVDPGTTSAPSTIPIQPNLAQALRYLRYPDRSRTLWIDAICINQHDNIERGRHVARMGSIYMLAPRVVAWLGPSSATSDDALDELEVLGRQREVTPNGSRRAPGADHPEWQFYYPCTPAMREALCRLFWDYAWWQRLWIWQEILLARSSTSSTDGGAVIQCGTKTASWFLVRRALRLLRQTTLPGTMRAGLCPAPVAWLPHAFAVLSTHDWDSLSYLMRSTSQSGCADPRDRVYALLGLVPRQLADSIVPDYNASVSQVSLSCVVRPVTSCQDVPLK